MSSTACLRRHSSCYAMAQLYECHQHGNSATEGENEDVNGREEEEEEAEEEEEEESNKELVVYTQ